jgi:hypothetical protein
LKSLLQKLRTECNDNNSSINKELLLLERKVNDKSSSNTKISLSDLSGLEEAINEENKKFLEGIEEQYRRLQHSIDEVKHILTNLRQNSDQVNASILTCLRQLEQKVRLQSPISTKEINDLKLSLSRDKHEFIHILEDKFAEMNILSIHKDMNDVKNLISKLRNENDSNNTALMEQLKLIERKSESKIYVTGVELHDLRSLLNESQLEIVDKMEEKLNSLDLLVDIKKDTNEIKHDIKFILDKLMNDGILSSNEKQSRETLIKKLKLSSTSRLQFVEGVQGTLANSAPPYQPSK